MKTRFLTHPVVEVSRAVLGEVGLGLGGAWATLAVLELARPASVVPFLDLNLVLAAAVLAWLLGSRPQEPPLGRPYVAAAVSGILAIALVLAFSGGTLYRLLALPSLLPTVLAWFVGGEPQGKPEPLEPPNP